MSQWEGRSLCVLAEPAEAQTGQQEKVPKTQSLTSEGGWSRVPRLRENRPQVKDQGWGTCFREL
jgi:hypothetical protein